MDEPTKEELFNKIVRNLFILQQLTSEDAEQITDEQEVELLKSGKQTYGYIELYEKLFTRDENILNIVRFCEYTMAQPQVDYPLPEYID